MRLPDVYAISVPRTQRRRLGRGWGSGIGKTSGRGEKGAGRRSGTRFRLRFEGGQMPLYRRLPKKGFTNYAFRVHFHGVNVGDLERAFSAGEVVDLEALQRVHLAPKNAALWKVLGDGALSKALTVRAHAASAGAKTKVAGAGGALEIIPGKHLDRAEALAKRRVSLATAAAARFEAGRAEARKANEARKAAPAKGEKGAKGAKTPKAEKGAKPEGAAKAPKGEKGGKADGGAKAAGGKPEGGAKGEGGKPVGGKPEGGGKAAGGGAPEGGKREGPRGEGAGPAKGQA